LLRHVSATALGPLPGFRRFAHPVCLLIWHKFYMHMQQSSTKHYTCYTVQGQKHNVTSAEHICAHSDSTSKRQPIRSVGSNSGLLAGGQYEFPGRSCQQPIRQMSPAVLVDPTINESSLPKFQVAVLPPHEALITLSKLHHKVAPHPKSKLSPNDQYLSPDAN